MIILDTNVVSALMTAEPKVQGWVAQFPAGDVYSTAITRAEIRFGLARLPDGRRRNDLTARADRAFEALRDRWLTFDSKAADTYGALVAERMAVGRPISMADAQIASVTVIQRASLATRNTRDFEHCGIEVLDPFAS